MTAACYILGQRYYPIPYNVGKSMSYIAATIAVVQATAFVHITNQWLATAFHLIVFFLYLFVIYLLEKREFKQASG